MTRVKVHTPTLLLDRSAFTASVSSALGVEPLLPSRSYVQAPWLTLDGRIHAPTSYFLAHHCRSSPNQKTASRMAHSLADWLRFLITERGHAPFSDHRDPILTATEDDFAAYHRARQYGVTPDGVNPDLEITSDSWRFTRSAVKRLYEYLHRRHAHPVPFPLVNTRFNGFTGTGVAGYRPRRTNTGSAGTPIDPHFTQLLLQAALRIDRDGTQSDYAGAERDHALLSLAFASGLRRSNLSHVTHYEVPAPTPRRDFTVMHVADHITKGDAGGDAMVFSHYLPAVWAYIHGRRTELAEDARHRPDKPLHVLTATEAAVTYTDPDNDEQRSPRPRPWARLDAATRRRLVDPDGSSPVLFLNEVTGDPLAYDSLSNIIESGRDFTRAKLEPTFPARFRIHDTRHTYAVHYLLAIYHGLVAKNLPKNRSNDYVVDHLAAALELVKASLGHASEASTRLYLSAAHRLLDVPPEHLRGEF